MTLREFVSDGAVGTRETRAAFEQALLEGWADTVEHGIPFDVNTNAIPAMWELCFQFWKVMQP